MPLALRTALGERGTGGVRGKELVEKCLASQ